METDWIGIIFNALISGLVAIAASMFVIFLGKRWKKLDQTMKTYAWIWGFTTLIWIGAFLRYIIIGFEIDGPILRLIDIGIQSLIILTGPALFYYLGLRLFKTKIWAQIMFVVSLLLAIYSISILIGQNGILSNGRTYFSDDVLLNEKSLVIFGVEAILAIALLLFDFFQRIYLWKKTHDKKMLYSALYSCTLLIYVFFAGIDNAKIINDWQLILFRILYAGAFLFAYLVIVEDESEKEIFSILKPEPINIQTNSEGS